MKERKKYLLVAIAAAILTLAVSAGLALAEDDAVPAGTAIAERGPGGPGGFGGPGERAMMIGGEVVSVSDSAITIKTIRNDEEAAVTINADTTYRNRDGEAALSDVVPGSKVGIKLTEPRAEGVELVAETVLIDPPLSDRPHPAVGDVTAVDGDTVTISTADGEKQFTIPEITEGMRLGVAADDDGNVKGLMYDPPQRPADAPAGAE